jgi:small subunit ribosomal protein S17
MTENKETSEVRNKRKMAQGIVVSDKMNKTRVVSVERIIKHPFYKKTQRRHSKFYAHDEANESFTGDLVEIMSIKPQSKLKKWRITRIIAKAK